MTNNFFLNAPELKKHLSYINENLADPQYNSFIITGDSIGGAFALEQFVRDLKQKHPLREILVFNTHSIYDFIKKTPIEMLTNFYRLHISLATVILTELDVEGWTKEEQDKLAVFLKTLTKHYVQVVAAFNTGASLTPEMWSWYMSGYQYHLNYGLVSYKKDLTCSLTLAQDRKRWHWLSRIRQTYHFGELYPGILMQDDEMVFNGFMLMELGLCWLGKFTPPGYIFPRAVCPTCGKIKLLPYSCIASALSGGHVIKFHCLNCHERIATNNAIDYYRILRTYGTRYCYIAKPLSKRITKQGE